MCTVNLSFKFCSQRPMQTQCDCFNPATYLGTNFGCESCFVRGQKWRGLHLFPRYRAADYFLNESLIWKWQKMHTHTHTHIHTHKGPFLFGFVLLAKIFRLKSDKTKNRKVFGKYFKLSFKGTLCNIFPQAYKPTELSISGTAVFKSFRCTMKPCVYIWISTGMYFLCHGGLRNKTAAPF